MKIVRRLVIGAVALVAVAVAVLVVLPQTLGEDHPVSQAIDGGKVAATNAAIDASGIKTKAQETLEDSSEAIASRTGLPLAVVDNAIEALDIESWQVAPKPTGATEKKTVDLAYGGTQATVTTYDDPSVVTVQMYGQAVTLAVPESSQPYLAYLTLMGGAAPAA